MSILKDIVENKRREVSKLKKNKPLDKLSRCVEIRDFKGAIKSGDFSIISEIKLKSPLGEWSRDVDPVEIAKLYEKSKSSAISVVTDKKFFGGETRFIPEVKKYTKKPILRKDFIIDEYQIREAFFYGADAVLLIASILSDNEIKNFIKIIRELGMSCLVECHTKEDIERINKIPGIEIYGINNRDLETMELDLNTTKKLIKIIPKEKVVVSESGIKNKEDIKFLKDLGVNAALIGTTIMLSSDVVKKIDELVSV